MPGEALWYEVALALALGHPVGRPLVGKLIREVRDQLNLAAFDLETAPPHSPSQTGIQAFTW